jgi:hypothetical protein
MLSGIGTIVFYLSLKAAISYHWDKRHAMR